MTSTAAVPGSEIDTGRQDLDVVFYLASLVSDTRAIDTELDSIRIITARLKPTDPIRTDDHTIINNVTGQLKHYLLTQEKFRAFTPESLEAQVNDFRHGAERQSFYRVLKIATIFTVVFIAAAMLVPLPISGSTRGLMASSLFFMMVHLAAAWLFLRTLQTFTSALRKAYSLIAWGVIVLGLGQIVQPIVALLHLESTPYNTLLSILPLIPSYMLMCLGGQKFARTVGQSLSKTTFLSVVGTGFLVLCLTLVLLHTVLSTSLVVDIIIVLQAINIVLVTLFGTLTRGVMRQVSTLYARPLRLLFLFTLISFLIGVYMYIVNLATSGIPSPQLLIPLIVGITANGFILLGAGYNFSRAGTD